MWCAALHAQVAISGRVVDENGAGIAGARVELRAAEGGLTAAASSDLAGNFRANLPSAGEYAVRVERLGFFLYQGRQQFESSNQLTIRLNHLQEFADKVDVTYSPPAIDPKQTSERKELANAEVESVPYPAPQDFRNALPLLNGVVQDNAGRVHFNGGDTNQANYTLDGFNISDPVTGRLEMRVNIDTIQSLDLESSRYTADNARGSSGVLDVKTKMGDDRWRFGGTNFIPAFRPRAVSTLTSGRRGWNSPGRSPRGAPGSITGLTLSTASIPFTACRMAKTARAVSPPATSRAFT